MPKKLSAASQRAANYPNKSSEWLCSFKYAPAKGLGPEEGIHRRDPSSVIEVEGTFYVWYTKSVGPDIFAYKGDNSWKIYPWDYADLWYASSQDGYTWKEEGCAIHRGEKGSYDDRTVCTPDILAHKGKYYLVYQCIGTGKDYTGGNEKVGMAVADSPLGPWNKLESEILASAPMGDFFHSSNNYNQGIFHGVVHDPMLLHYNDKFYLYYKCCGINVDGKRFLKYAGHDTRWGVAQSDKPEGPYTPSELNPVTNSGHETMLWPYKDGIAALLNRDGPEQNTLQYAQDGENFEIMSHTQFTPQAGGAFRCNDPDSHPLAGIRWGLCHVDERGAEWNYIFRFDTQPLNPDTFPKNYPPGR